MTKKFFRKAIAIKLLAILIISFSVTGCWGKKELNDISLVNVSGIDTAPNGEVRVSVLANTPIGGMQSSQTNKSNVWIGTATGSCILDAINNLDTIATKNLVWYHIKYIIISADAAKKYIREFSDLFARASQARLSAQILITEGKVLDLFQIPADIQKDLPSEIDGLVKNAAEISKAYIPTMKDIIAAESENADILAGKIGYYMSPMNTYSSCKEEYQKQYWINKDFGIAFVEGSAVIRGDKFVGFLNGNETRGCLWIINKVERGIITAFTPSDNGKNDNLAMEIIDAVSSLNPTISNNKIIMNVKLKVKGRLVETTSNLDILNPFDVKIIENLWAEQIKKEMSSGLKKVQVEYDSDILGFGETIKRKHPNEWRKIENDWRKEFKELQVNLDVKVILRRIGKTSFPIVNYKE